MHQKIVEIGCPGWRGEEGPGGRRYVGESLDRGVAQYIGDDRLMVLYKGDYFYAPRDALGQPLPPVSRLLDLRR